MITPVDTQDTLHPECFCCAADDPRLENHR